MTEARFRLYDPKTSFTNEASGTVSHKPTRERQTILHYKPSVDIAHGKNEASSVIITYGKITREVLPGEAPVFQLRENLYLEIAHLGMSEDFDQSEV